MHTAEAATAFANTVDSYRPNSLVSNYVLAGIAAADAIITEPAVQTVRGVFESTNRLVEDLAERLLTVWIDPEFDIAPPGELWKLEPPVQGSFSGFAPSPLPDGLSALAVSPREKERIALASRLQQEKLPKDVARKERRRRASPRRAR